ncbi:U1 small nuclear ribonucleoprotein 70 kDa-like [Wyeomyia smithii]|uniref:U1 small nuclear ribonucleoprotein 70 kDa-like n=1 Tax=Wyeomyia smithii TaxID=174621 RepID=UPI002467C49D|nr:U1 small nuclear ribonucleoprotein 70 kDa-like [Wyeomyia smithii]XP_055538919.1 U1 small nuclear ribonucleoprotein 70 kDa-like [Wyeomyia smithii]XP_055538923.1 U1 small nuclear ribonucleoprotein 70 kDa-like [Wyeomyia smithii]
MTQYLPPNLLALFAPREPIPFLPPPDKLPHEKKSQGYGGVGAFLDLFEDPKDTPPPTRVETREERIERRRRERSEQVAYKLEREIATWDPTQLAAATEDPFKTLFVARVNYDTSESKLRREFEIYGSIKKIILIHDKETGKPRGYAFIEYEHERDMHSAYKHADGKKIDGKRVLVDVERARTVKGWLPRRLGGGLGGTRRGGPDVNIKHSGREDNERERERYRLEREREDGMRERREPRFEQRPFDRRRSRSRDRDRRRRSRSKDRRRRHSREREHEEPERKDRWEKDRERSRERDRECDRERDRERDRDRDRDREKKRRRSRSRSRDREREQRVEKKRDKRDKDRERKERKPEFREGDIKIKEEPMDDYPDYSAQYAQYPMQVKTEDGVEEKYRPHEHEEENGAARGRVGENGARFGAMPHNNDNYNDRYGGY